MDHRRDGSRRRRRHLRRLVSAEAELPGDRAGSDQRTERPSQHVAEPVVIQGRAVLRGDAGRAGQQHRHRGTGSEGRPYPRPDAPEAPEGLDGDRGSDGEHRLLRGDLPHPPRCGGARQRLREGVRRPEPREPGRSDHQADAVRRQADRRLSSASSPRSRTRSHRPRQTARARGSSTPRPTRSSPRSERPPRTEASSSTSRSPARAGRTLRTPPPAHTSSPRTPSATRRSASFSVSSSASASSSPARRSTPASARPSRSPPSWGCRSSAASRGPTRTCESTIS